VAPRVDQRGTNGSGTVVVAHSTEEGNRRAPARGGHGTHWREGVARADVSGEGDIVETQNSGAMCTKLDRLSAPGAGGYPGTRGW